MISLLSQTEYTLQNIHHYYSATNKRQENTLYPYIIFIDPSNHLQILIECCYVQGNDWYTYKQSKTEDSYSLYLQSTQ